MFQEYTKLIENTLDQQLQARIPGFSMKAFETVLSERKGKLSDIRSQYSFFSSLTRSF